MDGYKVEPISQAVKKADVVITVTGNKHVLPLEHIKNLKDGAILANSGHFDVEIDVAGLKKIAKSVTRVRPFLDKYELGKKKIYVAGEGRLINLAAAEGHPSEVMDLSFAGQALSLEYIVINQGKLDGLIVLPSRIDQAIAKAKLKVLGIKNDTLTQKQIKYLNTWNEGT